MKVIPARPRRIDGFAVGRVLPAPVQRSVGPFVFLDHMGPAALAPGAGLDVRPHPHISLATVTYLFEGEVLHRDSLGSSQVIRPGAVNWMTAGRGIVHSERTPAALRAEGPRLHGLQLWVALPTANEEDEPSFHHHPAETMPVVDTGAGAGPVRVVVGDAYGVTSPVRVSSPMFTVDAELAAGAVVPLPDGYQERAVYVVSGAVTIGDARLAAGELGVLPADARQVRAETASRVVLLGGDVLDGGPRHIWWNFVSSSRERIEEAARAWREGKFPRVPGDETEYVPLPDESFRPR